MRFMKLGNLTLIAALAVGTFAGGISTASAQQGEIIIRTQPPSPRYEQRGRARAGYEWVPGYWRWDRGRHVWVAGHWERARRGWVWQPARWDRRRDGWVFIPGRWVRSGRHTPPPYNEPPRGGPGYDRDHDHDRGDRGRGRGYWERQGWVLLGEQQVRGNQDHDYVPIGRRSGRFTRIMFVADEGDFEMHDVVIVFSNGRSWSPTIRHYFREGQRSRSLILPNAPRGLRSVKLHYGNVGRRRERPARVEVWAR